MKLRNHLRRIRASAACVALLLAPSIEARDASRAVLYYLNYSGKVMRVDVDGSHKRELVGQLGMGPDGIAVDSAARHLYWTNMGGARHDDGTITRANFDGTAVRTLVSAGGTFTPKQLKLDLRHGKMYWSDREGMRVMRADLDGSHIETLVTTAEGDAARVDQRNWCVGIALDVDKGHVYWSQKGGDNAGHGRILRTNLQMRPGEDSRHRSDIEVLFDQLPEPIDLDLDLRAGFIYWTDRGDNTVSRAPMNKPMGMDPAKRTDRQILVRGLREAIGISLDLRGKRMFYTSLGGELGVADLDGGHAKLLLTDEGALTGIAFVE